MPVPFKKDPVEFGQRKLMAENVFDLLPGDHDCFVYEDIFSQIDTAELENKYKHAWPTRVPSKANNGNTYLFLQPGNIQFKKD